MTITTDRAAQAAKDPRELVPPEVWNLLVEDLRRYHHVTLGYAERSPCCPPECNNMGGK